MSHAIAITSILKPVDAVRAFHRIGLTLAQNDHWQVNIIGFGRKNLIINEKIKFFVLPTFSRLGFSRLASQWHIWKAWKTIKPKIIIIETIELLPLALIYKLLHHVKLVYDIQENYS